MAEGKPSYSLPGMVTSSTLESVKSFLATASKKTSNRNCQSSEPYISRPETYISRATQSGNETDHELSDALCSYPVTNPSRPRPMLGIYFGSTQNSSMLNAARASPVFTVKSPSAGSLPSPSSNTSLSPHVQPVASPVFQTLASPVLQPEAIPSIFPSYFVDIEVQLKPGCADIILRNRVGIVRKVSGKTATVHIRETSSHITVPHDSLMPVHPRLLDTVKVIGGSGCMLGLIGTLLSIPIPGKEGLVQFFSWNSRKRNSTQISLSYLGRYLPTSKFCPEVSPFSSGGLALSDSTAMPTSTTRNGQVSYPSNIQLVQVSPAHSSYLTLSGSSLPLSFSTSPFSLRESPRTSAVSSTFSGNTTPPAIPNLSRSTVQEDKDECDSVSRGQAFHPFMTANSKRPASKNTPASQLLALNNFTIDSNRNLVFSRLGALEPASSRTVSMHQPGFVSSSTDVSMPLNATKEADLNKRILSRITEIQYRLNNGSVVGHGGGAEEHSTSDMIEKLVRSQRDYPYEWTDPTTPGGGSHDVKASCVRVSLVCPLGQQRMKYPSRGKSCKHFQCFDAENYINFHRKQIFRHRLKHHHHHKAVLDKSWNCPICEKMTPVYHIYIDRALMKLVDKTNATEVQLNDDGSWAPVKKDAAVVVIDLTGDD